MNSTQITARLELIKMSLKEVLQHYTRNNSSGQYDEKIKYLNHVISILEKHD